MELIEIQAFVAVLKFIQISQQIQNHPDFKKKFADNPDLQNRELALKKMIEEVLAKQRKQELELYKLHAKDESFKQSFFDTMKRIVDKKEEKPLSVEELAAKGEGLTIEFKSTLRVNMHTKQNDPKMEHSVLKTINGFLNSDGGTLVIGVADDGVPVGVEVDKFPNEDKMDLHPRKSYKVKDGGSYNASY